MVYRIRKYGNKPARDCIWISNSENWAKIKVAQYRDRNAYLIVKNGEYHIIMDAQ